MIVNVTEKYNTGAPGAKIWCSDCKLQLSVFDQLTKKHGMPCK